MTSAFSTVASDRSYSRTTGSTSHDAAVCYPLLCAVYDIFIAVELGCCLGPSCITARVGLSQAESHEPFTSCNVRKIFLFLEFAAEQKYRVSAKRIGCIGC